MEYKQYSNWISSDLFRLQWLTFIAVSGASVQIYKWAYQTCTQYSLKATKFYWAVIISEIDLCFSSLFSTGARIYLLQQKIWTELK